ncbi:MAG: radical SAM protein [Deltaproteobacteria bacterium]|nr:radical SAM protein [Deltaproteobacteria bacterium]
MKQTKTYLHNPGYLKIDLMLKGIRVDKEVLKKANMDKCRNLFDVACGIDVILPHNTWVTVPYIEDFTKDSPYELMERDGRFFITHGDESVQVSVVPTPEFYTLKTTTGIQLSRIGLVHGGYVAITPATQCDFFNKAIECRYCAGNLDIYSNKGRVYSVEDVLETVEAAYKEGKAEIVYISIGFSDTPDGGIEFLKPYIQAIKKHFNTLVAVEALPPKENRWVDETYAVGADSVLYNLEIFNPKLFDEICPGRATLIGRERYLDALRYATTIFPNGTVASHLIVGLEPIESTMSGIDYFTNIGVVPILPIYRPSLGAKLSQYKMPATKDIAPLYGHLYRAVTANKINTTWVRDISIVTTPLEGRFFVGDEARMKTWMQNFYKSRLGLKAAWSLATLRRKLKVKVGESSAHRDK